MSSIINSAYYPLWIAHPVLEVVLAAVIWRRKLYRVYPFFFSYLVSEVVLFLVLFANQKNYDRYFYLYWFGAGISALFGFKVIHEVFVDVLRPFHALRDFSSMLVRWAGLVVMLIAVLAAMSGAGTGFNRITAGLLSLERSVRVMQCGMILFLLMFSRYLGISRRHRSFGVALGFGIFAAAELLAFGLRVSGIMNPTALSLAIMASYDVAVIAWLGYFTLPVTEQRRSEVLLQPQRWEVSLAELTQPAAPESLMPMFDAMVDRALSKAETADRKIGAAPAASLRDLPAKKKPEASVAASTDIAPAAFAATANQSS